MVFETGWSVKPRVSRKDAEPRKVWIGDFAVYIYYLFPLLKFVFMNSSSSLVNGFINRVLLVV